MEKNLNTSSDPLLDKPITITKKIKKYFCGCIPYEVDDPGTGPRTGRRGTLIGGKFKIEGYAPNTVHLIGSGKSRTFALVTHVSLKYAGTPPLKELPPGMNQTLWDQRTLYFSKFEEGVDVALDQWNGVIPEVIMNQIMSDDDFTSLIDAYPGAATVHLAKKARVTAVEPDPTLRRRLWTNAQIYDRQHKLDLVDGDIAQLMPTKTAQAVFIAPHIAHLGDNKSLDLTTAIEGLSKRIKLASGSAEGLILYLPKNIDPDQLVAIIRGSSGMDAVLEIKVFYINNEIESSCVYIGNLANVPYDEILSLMVKVLQAQDIDQISMLVRIIERMGLLNTVDIMSETESITKNGGMRKPDGSGFYSVFDTFICIACLQGSFSIDDIAGPLSDSDEDEYYDEEESIRAPDRAATAPAAVAPPVIVPVPVETTPEPAPSEEIKIIEQEVVGQVEEKKSPEFAAPVEQPVATPAPVVKPEVKQIPPESPRRKGTVLYKEGTEKRGVKALINEVWNNPDALRTQTRSRKVTYYARPGRELSKGLTVADAKSDLASVYEKTLTKKNELLEETQKRRARRETVMKIKADKEAERKRAQERLATTNSITEEDEEDSDDEKPIKQHADEGMEVLDNDFIEPVKRAPVGSGFKASAAAAAPTSQQTPVLAYWGIVGRGDQCRILLHHLGVAFEDKFYTPGDDSAAGWPNQKDKLGMLFPNLPYFNDGENIHAETLPVLRSICRKYCPEYLGRNQTEQAYADTFANTIYGDFGPWLGAAFFAPDYKEKSGVHVASAQKICETIQKCLGNNRFIAGGLTYVDFMVYWALKYMIRFDASIIMGFPKIVTYVNEMHSLKGVAGAEAEYDKIPLLPPFAAWMNDHPHGSEAALAIPAAPASSGPVVLAYWGIVGRGDQCRILLKHLGVPFEDKFYTPGDDSSAGWPQQKDKLGMLFPNLPYFNDGENVHAETLPVLRSICRKYCPEYLGRNQTEQAYADTFANTIYGDFGPWLGAAFFAPDYKEKAGVHIASAQKICETIQKCLGNNRFIAGGLTYVDFMIYWALKYMIRFDTSIIMGFPKIVTYVNEMHSLKGVSGAEAEYDIIPLLPPFAAWMNDHPHGSEAALVIPAAPASTQSGPVVLAYWGIVGRGDQCRILLKHLGVPFEDKFYTPGDDSAAGWPQSKDKLGMLFPNLPYFSDGENVHAETLPVLRSICRKFCPEYLGRNQTEQAYADTFANTIYGDFGPWLGAAFFAPDYKEKAGVHVASAQKICETIQKCLGNNKFIAGGLTYVDFMVYWALKYMIRFDASIVMPFPKILAYVDEMHSLKGVVAAEAEYDKIPLLPPFAAWMNDHPHGSEAALVIPTAPASTTATPCVLAYWGIVGRGDQCRILLKHLGVPFEDKFYIPGDDTAAGWPASKEKLGMLFPNLPYFSCGDITHAETLPVLRSICRQYCPQYLGRNQTEQAYADSFANTIYGDFGPWLGAAFFAPDYKAKKENHIESAMKICETIQNCLGNKKFIAGGLTYVDFMVYWALKYFNIFDLSIIQSFPNIETYVQNMHALKNVKDAEAHYNTIPLLPPFAAWHNDHPVAHDTIPIVVISQRHIKSGFMKEYKTLYAAAREYFKKAIPGFHSLITFNDHKDPNAVHDVQFFSDMDAFMAHADMSNEETKNNLAWAMMYDQSKPMTGIVYGGWDDRVQQMTQGFGAQFTFVTAKAGFIRLAPAGRGPPTIVSSQRRVQPGKMQSLLEAQQSLADYYKEHDMGVVAIVACPDDNDPTLVHDLQIFADDEGFVTHADQDNPNVQQGFQKLFANYDMSAQPAALVGLAIANDSENVAKTTGSNGAQFDVYGYNDNTTGGIDLSPGVGKTNKENALSFNFHCNINPGKELEFKALMKAGRDKTQTEEGCLDYTWCLKDDSHAMIRETYLNSDAFKHHFANLGEELATLGQLAQITHVVVSGPAEGLNTIKPMVEPLGAVFYEKEFGFRKETHSAIQLQPFFEIKPGKEAELKAHISLLTNKAMRLDGVLDYTCCFNGNKFIMREAYVSADAVFEYVGFMGDTLGKLHELATLQNAEATGPEDELLKLKPALDQLGMKYYFKYVGLVVQDNALCLNFHVGINEGQESEFRENMQQAVRSTQTEENCLDYTWCYKPDSNLVIIRESYSNAEAFLQHMQIAGQFVERLNQLSTLQKIEVTGPASELAKVRPTLEPMGPTYYTAKPGGFRRDAHASIGLQPCFQVNPGKKLELIALIELITSKARTLEGVLDYVCCFDGDKFMMREGYASPDDLFAYAGLMGDLLNKLHSLATITKLDATGTAEDLEKLAPAIGPLGAVYYYKEAGISK